MVVDGTVWNAEGCVVTPCFDRAIAGATIVAQPDGVRAVTDGSGRFTLQLEAPASAEYRCATLEVWQNGIRRYRLSELRLFSGSATHFTPGLRSSSYEETFSPRWAASRPCPAPTQ
jgi:hypothetical protein